MKRGFTLAEVLLVLSIIGVVSALTIPTLVQKVYNDQYKAALRKTYSNLAQATSRIATDNGGTIKALCQQTSSDSDCWKDYYKKYFVFTKECSEGTNLGNCWPNMGGGKGANYLSIDSPAYTSWWQWNSGAVLSDGTLVAFQSSESGLCTATSQCFHIFIDVNGLKGPNTFGKDVYYIKVFENSISPNGDGSSCSGDGLNCSSYYLIN